MLFILIAWKNLLNYYRRSYMWDLQKSKLTMDTTNLKIRNKELTLYETFKHTKAPEERSLAKKSHQRICFSITIEHC